MPVRRPALVAVISALSVLAMLLAGLTGLTVATAPVATAEGCSQLEQGTVRVRAQERTTWKMVYYSHSGQVSYSATETRRGPVGIGSVNLRVRTCKSTSTGRWRVLDIDVRQPHTDLLLTVRGRRVVKVEPNSGNKGYAVVVRRVGSNLELDALRCTEKPQGFKNGIKKTLKALTAIPLPTSYVTGLGQLALNLALPDAEPQKYWCGRMGKEPLQVPFKVTAKGKPALVWGSSTKRSRTTRTTFEQPCSAVRYCAEIWDETVTVRKP